MSDFATIRQKNRDGRSLTLRLFALTINFYLLFLLLKFNFFRNGAIFFGVLLVLFAIIELSRSRKVKNQFKSGMNINDIVRMSLKYLKINRIFIVVSILGLILATVVVSQTAILSASYEQRSFQKFSENVDTTAIRFTGNYFQDEETVNDWLEFLPDIEDELSRADMTLESITTSSNYRSLLQVNHIQENEFDKYVPSDRIGILEYTEELHEFYNQFFNFDYNEDEVIFVQSSFYREFVVGEEEPFTFNGTANLIYGQEYGPANATFTLREVPYNYTFKIDENVAYDYMNDNGDYSLWDRFGFNLLLPTNLFDEIIESYGQYLVDNPEAPYSGLSKIISSKVDIVMPNISDIDIDALIANFEKLQRNLWVWLEKFYSDHPGSWVDYRFPLYDALRDYQQDVSGLNSTLFLVMAPLIALALFLVYFSLSLVENRKQRLMAILRMRGSGSDQLRIMLVDEVLLSSLMAIVVGMALSIPAAFLALQNTLNVGLFDLSLVTIPTDWYYTLPQIGVILALDVNIPGINKLIKTSVDEGEMFEEKKEPFWQRYSLDLVLFGISVAFMIAIRLINMENLGFYIFLVIMLTPVMLIIFFIGAPLVIARYFSSLIGIFSDTLWDKQSGMFALATRNMKKNKFSASRLASFLLLGMMLSYMAIIVPGSFDQWNIDRVNYDTGTDIYISGIDSSNQTAWEMMNIEGVVGYSEVLKTQIYTGSFQLGVISILGVDTGNFSKAAYWDDSYASESLDSLMGKLTTNTSMLMQAKVAESLDLNQGDTYRITEGFTQEEQQKAFELELEATFTYFPRLVYSLPFTDDQGNIYAYEGQIITSIGSAKNLSKMANQPSYGAYVKTETGANISAIAALLSEIYAYNTSISVTNIEDALEELNTDSQIAVIFSALSSMLIITIIASIIAVGYFSFITLAERKREIGTFRAMGMVKKQIFMLLVIEGLIILSISMFMGAIAGYVASANIFFFFQQMFGVGGAESAPPINLYVPWDIVGQFSVAMVLLTIIAAAYPAQSTASKQTGSILRAE